jgi:hypothetical protein
LLIRSRVEIKMIRMWRVRETKTFGQQTHRQNLAPANTEHWVFSTSSEGRH